MIPIMRIFEKESRQYPFMTRNNVLLSAVALLFGAVSFAQVHRMDIGLKKKETVKAVECVKFHSDFLYQDNTLDAPEQVVPVKASFTGEGKTLSATVEPLTFAVYILTR